jgi:hypothetical protein
LGRSSNRISRRVPAAAGLMSMNCTDVCWAGSSAGAARRRGTGQPWTALDSTLCRLLLCVFRVGRRRECGFQNHPPYRALYS